MSKRNTHIKVKNTLLESYGVKHKQKSQYANYKRPGFAHLVHYHGIEGEYPI